MSRTSLTNRWSGLTAAALLLASAGAAFGKPPHAPHHGRRGPPLIEQVLERHAERLGLDAQARARIEEIADAAQAESEPLRETLHALHDELRAELAKDAPEEATVMQLAERIGAAETDERKLRLRSMLRIRALLTEQQRAELVKIHAERRRDEPRHGPPR